MLADRKTRKELRQKELRTVNNRVPIIGQQQAAQQAAVAQLYHAAFLGVLPAVAQVRLAGPWSDGERVTADAIALEADRLAIAAMKRLGITITKEDI